MSMESERQREAYIAILEPLVGGLIDGTKKLVIDSKPASSGWQHTIKVVDCAKTDT